MNAERLPAKAVIGLGFGDEGKGMAVAHEVEKASERGLVSTVVRFNGGPQAAHNVRVKRDGKILHHTHSQFGSGALLGAHTIITDGMLFDPIAFNNELRHISKLMGTNMANTVTVSHKCPLVTPLHVLANREVESMRGDARHGSTGCGIGIARACDNAATSGHAYNEMRLTVWDVYTNHAGAGELIRKLYYWRSYIDLHYGTHLCKTISDDDLWSWALQLIDSMHAREVNMCAPELGCCLRDSNAAVVFEGSQGMLLDKKVGWFPHVTYGDMDAFEARRLCDGYRDIKVIGVTRSYQTRHGNGPMPTEGTCDIPEVDNETSEWAGGFRTGLLDIPNLKRAAESTCIDEIAISHLDRYPGRCAVAWMNRVKVDGIDRPVPHDMRSMTMTQSDMIETVEALCEVPVTVVGRGPTTDDWHDYKTGKF